MFISKYTASGNDFVIFHTFLLQNYSLLAKELCNRSDGIGADGLIVLLPCDKLDFKWLFYNSDGSEAKMCGNGTRAVAHYAFFHKLVAKKQMSFTTGAGRIDCDVEGDIVTTTLTEPIIKQENFQDFGLDLDFYDTGVPHVVVFVKNLEEFDLQVASKIRHKYDANVNFAKVDSSNRLFVRTFERGVEGETMACGTGMAAAFLAALRKGYVENRVDVYPASNEKLELKYKNDLIYFKGKVKQVFNSSI